MNLFKLQPTLWQVLQFPHQFLNMIVGHGGTSVKSMTLNRRVVGSTPALAARLGPSASPKDLYAQDQKLNV